VDVTDPSSPNHRFPFHVDVVIRIQVATESRSVDTTPENSDDLVGCFSPQERKTEECGV